MASPQMAVAKTPPPIDVAPQHRFADINVIWAREEESNQVKGFVVGKDNPGFSVEKMKTKMALRVVQNGLITLTNCRVPERNRLQNASSFKDTAKFIKMTRTGVAIYSYEGTREMNTLIVGKSITGLSAFV